MYVWFSDSQHPNNILVDVDEVVITYCILRLWFEDGCAVVRADSDERWLVDGMRYSDVRLSETCPETLLAKDMRNRKFFVEHGEWEWM